MDTSNQDSKTSPFPLGYRASGLLLHVTRCHRRTESVISGRVRSPGLTVCASRAKRGGKPCRWGQRAMATRRINASRRSLAMGC